MGVVSYLERGELGERAPGIDTVERLARALGCTACWLAYGEEGPLVFAQKRAFSEHPMEGPQGAHEIGALQSEGLARRLLLLRELRGLSRRALGRAANTSGTTILNLEAGRHLPTVATAEQLAVALEVAPCWLAFGVGEGDTQRMEE